MSAHLQSDPPRTLEEAIGIIDELRSENGELRFAQQQLQDRFDDLQVQVQQLLDQISKNSGNSSKSPSSDSIAQKAARKRRKPPSRKNKGAQPGHPKHERAQLPESEVDETRRYFPSISCGCGAKLKFELKPSCRHQVFDLPVVRYTVTEHQLFSGQCECCGKRAIAELPQGVPSGQMGPGLVAWIALMAGDYRMSVRQIQRLLREQWNLGFSNGAISEAQGLANRALLAPYCAIGEHVRAQAVAHADETRHPRGGDRDHAGTWWLWALVSVSATFMGVHFSRGKQAAAELLGDFGGYLVTDDYAGYNGVPAHRRQLCWSHLIRHFVAISERRGRGGEIGRRLLLLARMVIRTRHRVDDGRLDDVRYRRRMHRLRRSVRAVLQKGAQQEIDGKTRRQCAHLLKREAMLWTFMADRRIPLENNRAERALRPYVIWRKLSFASHSRRGDGFRAMSLSVSETARQNGVPIYQFLRTICREALTSDGVTSRLPLGTPRLLS